MIRFSALLVALAIGLLAAGVAASSLPLVYVSIAVCAVAALLLAAGVLRHWAEIFGPRAQRAASPFAASGPVPSPATAGRASAGRASAGGPRRVAPCRVTPPQRAGPARWALRVWPASGPAPGLAQRPSGRNRPSRQAGTGPTPIRMAGPTGSQPIRPPARPARPGGSAARTRRTVPPAPTGGPGARAGQPGARPSPSPSQRPPRPSPSTPPPPTTCGTGSTRNWSRPEARLGRPVLAGQRLLDPVRDVAAGRAAGAGDVRRARPAR